MSPYDNLTQAGRDLLNEHASRSAIMVKHVSAVEQEATARALARVAEHEPFVDDDRMISCVCGHLVGRVNDPESFYTHLLAPAATEADRGEKL